MKTITTNHLKFLKDLKTNNNREWFKKNKSRYDKVREEVKGFFEAIYHEMQKTDSLQEFHMHRIYRDLRFSQDKTPYKTWFRLYLGRTKPLLRGGYYLNIEPGKSAVSGGFWKPKSKDLLRIRRELAIDAQPLRKILVSAKFKKYFSELQGEELSSAPRSFNNDDPAIDLLRKKQFIVRRYFTDEEVTAPGFFKEVINTFLALRPFFDYMSEILTTDENGESLYH
ncbi:MAG: DUF2461 domain-containing protein [Chitinophagaceae bacterium]|nr:DUF2461 domain-containing protein [Chitinophagaceae bacterium]